MSEEIFNKLVSLRFSHHADNLSNEIKQIAAEMNAKKLYGSGRALTAYAREANDRKIQIVNEAKEVMQTFHRENKTNDFDFVEISIKSFKSIFHQLDEIVRKYIRRGSYSGKERALEQIDRSLDQETAKGLSQIRDIALTLDRGFSVTTEQADMSENVNINSTGNISYKSEIHGNLTTNIEIIEKTSPDVAQSIRLLEEAIRELEPEKKKEGEDLLSAIAGEAVKPEADQNKGMIKTCLNTLHELAKSVKDSQTIMGAIESIRGILS